ncbi:hypothetical protein [Pseudonocardia lacus]|uniref:hypothetical protein n=1 Tax=Pseudonocardia lacus TaxID=2835865 RepID=UPI001BDD4050|nr:hypothetical protein [Pseudonocardia lacus]
MTRTEPHARRLRIGPRAVVLVLALPALLVADSRTDAAPPVPITVDGPSCPGSRWDFTLAPAATGTAAAAGRPAYRQDRAAQLGGAP